MGRIKASYTHILSMFSLSFIQKASLHNNSNKKRRGEQEEEESIKDFFIKILQLCQKVPFVQETLNESH